MLDKRKKPGRLAQLVELLPYKQAVTGSSPVPSILKKLKSRAYREIWRLYFFSESSPIRLNPQFFADYYPQPDNQCPDVDGAEIAETGFLA
jgi:hypothetical protein